MLLYLRLVLLLVASSVVFSPITGFAAEYKNKFYIVSLKGYYTQKKYKVRAFFLESGSNVDIYSVPKMPRGWHYGFNHGRSTGLFAAAYTDKEAVDIESFKNFLTFIIVEPKQELSLIVKLICHKPDGTSEILFLDTEDFIIKEIHSGLKRY
ncbi:MAG: hypothetical protein H7843_06955 [Nitrospirota bacterium]